MTTPTLTDLIYRKKNYLTEDQCEIIINEFETSMSPKDKENCLHAFTGVNTTSTYMVKTCQQGSKAFNIIHQTVENVINEYHDYLDTFDAFHVSRRASMLYPHKYRLMKYAKGAWIHPHVDDDASGINGSCTINLNSDYEGGTFAFWGGKHKVKLGRGDVMIWPADYSFWVHEVEEITKGTRYSANCFLCDKPKIDYGGQVKYNVKGSDVGIGY